MGGSAAFGALLVPVWQWLPGSAEEPARPRTPRPRTRAERVLDHQLPDLLSREHRARARVRGHCLAGCSGVEGLDEGVGVEEVLSALIHLVPRIGTCRPYVGKPPHQLVVALAQIFPASCSAPATLGSQCTSVTRLRVQKIRVPPSARAPISAPSQAWASEWRRWMGDWARYSDEWDRYSSDGTGTATIGLGTAANGLGMRTNGLGMAANGPGTRRTDPIRPRTWPIRPKNSSIRQASSRLAARSRAVAGRTSGSPAQEALPPVKGPGSPAYRLNLHLVSCPACHNSPRSWRKASPEPTAPLP